MNAQPHLSPAAEAGRLGHVLTSTFLRSCALAKASDQNKIRYEDLDLRTQLNSLYRGDITCLGLETLVLQVQRLSSLRMLNDKRFCPSLMVLIGKYT
jgi:hypothetical protein